jgi:hypothetical protein
MAKIRNGFVSNSSSSSFICDFCGYNESGYDLCLSDVDMSQCEKGHTFCNDHVGIGSMFDKFGPDSTKKLIEYCKDNVDQYTKKINTEQIKTEQEKYRYEKSIEYYTKLYNFFKSHSEDSCILDFTDEYEELVNTDLEDFIRWYYTDMGIPSEFCPVCRRKVEMQEDEDYLTYKNLYDKFKGVDPEGRKYI